MHEHIGNMDEARQIGRIREAFVFWGKLWKFGRLSTCSSKGFFGISAIVGELAFMPEYFGTKNISYFDAQNHEGFLCTLIEKCM